MQVFNQFPVLLEFQSEEDSLTDNFKLIATSVRRQDGEKPYVCQQCYDRFIKSSNLKTHIQSHSEEKHYASQQCEKRITEFSNLKTHLRTHNGEKPVACQQCEQRFSGSGHLKKHLQTHRLTMGRSLLLVRNVSRGLLNLVT